MQTFDQSLVQLYRNGLVAQRRRDRARRRGQRDALLPRPRRPRARTRAVAPAPASVQPAAVQPAAVQPARPLGQPDVARRSAAGRFERARQHRRAGVEHVLELGARAVVRRPRGRSGLGTARRRRRVVGARRRAGDGRRRRCTARGRVGRSRRGACRRDPGRGRRRRGRSTAATRRRGGRAGSTRAAATTGRRDARTAPRLRVPASRSGRATPGTPRRRTRTPRPRARYSRDASRSGCRPLRRR